jgi:hypothetical protein
MSQFLNDLEVRLCGWEAGKAKWTTLALLRYRSDLVGGTVCIPAEFVTDFASVPRLPLAYLLAGGRAIRPAVLHDYAYQTHRLPVEGGDPRTLTREEADHVFLEAMQADPWSGTSPWTRRLMWRAVRCFGGATWDQYGDRQRALNPLWTAKGWPDLPK